MNKLYKRNRKSGFIKYNKSNLKQKGGFNIGNFAEIIVTNILNGYPRRLGENKIPRFFRK